MRCRISIGNGKTKVGVGGRGTGALRIVVTACQCALRPPHAHTSVEPQSVQQKIEA